VKGEDKKVKLIQWEVARLIMQINAGDTALKLETPPGHKKFLRSVEESQALLNIYEKDGNSNISSKMTLQICDLPFENELNQGTALLCSDTWEYWVNLNGSYEFVLPYEEIPAKVTVEPDFSMGVIQGDFSSNGNAIYPLKNLENRVFSAWLANLGDIILHASGVMVDGKGYCFLGDPGAGKSTLAAALAADPGVTVLGEDQVVLRYLEGCFWIFGTPWHINEDMCSPKGIPVEKIFFLDRTLKPGITRITPLDGITRILQTAFIPYYQSKWVPGILDHLGLLSQQVPFYLLSYQLGIDPLQIIKSA